MIIKEMNKTSLVFTFFLVAIGVGLLMKYKLAIPMPSSKESFMQQEIGKPLNSGGMGPYDESSLVSGWQPSEPLPVSTSPANSHEDPNKLMSLVGNKTSPDCCPSAFNTDTGCVCLTDSDRSLFASRGGNKA